MQAKAMGSIVATKSHQERESQPRSQQHSPQTSSRREPSLALESLSSQSSGDENDSDDTATNRRNELVFKCIESLRTGLGLSFQREERIMENVEEINLEPGDIVLKRGESAVGIFIVQEGWLEVLSPREDTVLCKLGKKEFCGELSSFFRTSCSATVRTPPDTAVRLTATCSCVSYLYS